MPSIPKPHPVGDVFSGALLQYATAHFLAPHPIEGTTHLETGAFMVRYGIPYLEKPHMAIVPGLVVADYGEMLTDDAMWDFIHKRGNAYPRADVVGYLLNGEEEMVVLKKLDIGQLYRVLVYGDEATTSPITAVDALIAPQVDDVSARLLDYLPHYPTLGDWLNRHT